MINRRRTGAATLRRAPHRSSAALPVLVVTWAATGHAYPEFQRHIQSTAGQVVSCALCHAHPEGPDGSKHGQIGGLSPRERESLAQSRAQLEPGPVVNNPILNDFGDYLVASLGRNRLIELRSAPDRLTSAIAADHDQDRDGIADARELNDGTDPTDPRHGHPGLLLAVNARRHWAELALAGAATLFGLFGLNRLLRAFSERQRTRGPRLNSPSPSSPGAPAALAKRFANH